MGLRDLENAWDLENNETSPLGMALMSSRLLNAVLKVQNKTQLLNMSISSCESNCNKSCIDPYLCALYVSTYFLAGI
jgi:hypothetical protein